MDAARNWAAYRRGLIGQGSDQDIKTYPSFTSLTRGGQSKGGTSFRLLPELAYNNELRLRR